MTALKIVSRCSGKLFEGIERVRKMRMPLEQRRWKTSRAHRHDLTAAYNEILSVTYLDNRDCLPKLSQSCGCAKAKEKLELENDKSDVWR
jgi:hypothetical protein